MHEVEHLVAHDRRQRRQPRAVGVARTAVRQRRRDRRRRRPRARGVPRAARTARSRPARSRARGCRGRSRRRCAHPRARSSRRPSTRGLPARSRPPRTCSIPSRACATRAAGSVSRADVEAHRVPADAADPRARVQVVARVRDAAAAPGARASRRTSRRARRAGPTNRSRARRPRRSGRDRDRASGGPDSISVTLEGPSAPAISRALAHRRADRSTPTKRPFRVRLGERHEVRAVAAADLEHRQRRAATAPASPWSVAIAKRRPGSLSVVRPADVRDRLVRVAQVGVDRCGRRGHRFASVPCGSGFSRRFPPHAQPRRARPTTARGHPRARRAAACPTRDGPAEAPPGRHVELVERDQRHVEQPVEPQHDRRDGTPAARFDAIQWSRSAGAVITVPEPISPLGGTPSRTMNARLPGSIARKRPHDHSVSKCPRRASVRMSSASDGQFQSFGLKAKRCVVIRGRRPAEADPGGRWLWVRLQPDASGEPVCYLPMRVGSPDTIAKRAAAVGDRGDRRGVVHVGEVASASLARRATGHAGTRRRRATTRTTARATACPANLDAIPDAVAARSSRCIASPIGRTRCSAATTCRRPRCGRTGARHRVVVRPQVPRREDVDRRDLRHVRDDRRAPDAAAAVVCARHQRRDGQERRRARQRPRPVPARPRHRPVVRRGAPDRHRAEGQRRGRGRGDHSRATPALVGRRAAAAGRRRRRDGAAGAAAARRRRAVAGRARRRRLRRAARARSRASPMRRTSSRTCRTSSPPREVEPQGARRSTGCSASTSARTPTRDEARARRRPPRAARSASRPRSRRIEARCGTRAPCRVVNPVARAAFVIIGERRRTRDSRVRAAAIVHANEIAHAPLAPPSLLAARSRCLAARPSRRRARSSPSKSSAAPAPRSPSRSSRSRTSRTWPLGISGIVGADLDAQRASSGWSTTPASSPRPARAEDVRSATWRARGADAVVVGSMRPLPDGRVEVRFALVDVVKQAQLAAMTLHRHAGAVPRHRAQDRRRHLRKAHRRRRRVLDAHRLHHQAGHALPAASSPTPTAAIRRRSSPRTSRCCRRAGRPTARASRTCRSRTRSPSSTCRSLATGQRQVVANFRGSNSAPAWSPDGRRLAVTLTKDGGSQLFLINADGSGVQRLLTFAGHRHRGHRSRRTAVRSCSRPIAAARRRSTG